MSKILVGLEDALHAVLKSFFNVDPKVDPELLGLQNNPPNAADYDGFPPVPNSPIAIQLIQDEPDIVVPKAAVAWQGRRDALSPSVTPIRIVNANRARRRVTIYNYGDLTATNRTIAVGSHPGINFNTGLAMLSFNVGFIGIGMPPSITIATTGEVWAIPDPTTLVVTYLGILEELDEGGNTTP